MNRRLKIVYKKTNSGYAFRITEQTARTSQFTDRGGEESHSFKPEGMGGFNLHSSAFPEVQDYSDSLAVRGNARHKDNYVLKCKPSFFREKVKPAIMQYNQYYSKNTLEWEDVAEEVEDVQAQETN